MVFCGICSWMCGARAQLGLEGPSRDAPSPSSGTAAAHDPHTAGTALHTPRCPAHTKARIHCTSKNQLVQATLNARTAREQLLCRHSQTPEPPRHPGAERQEGRGGRLLSPVGDGRSPEGAGCTQSLGSPSSGPVVPAWPSTECPMAHRLVPGKSQSIPAWCEWFQQPAEPCLAHIRVNTACV